MTAQRLAGCLELSMSCRAHDRDATADLAAVAADGDPLALSDRTRHQLMILNSMFDQLAIVRRQRQIDASREAD